MARHAYDALGVALSIALVARSLDPLTLAPFDDGPR
jgi:hypothetical protein